MKLILKCLLKMLQNQKIIKDRLDELNEAVALLVEIETKRVAIKTPEAGSKSATG